MISNPFFPETPIESVKLKLDNENPIKQDPTSDDPHLISFKIKGNPKPQQKYITIKNNKELQCTISYQEIRGNPHSGLLGRIPLVQSFIEQKANKIV